jgi:hypothetical protein
MKPGELREARRRAAYHRAQKEKDLEAWVAGRNPLTEVNADLIPTDEDFRTAVDQMNTVLRRAERGFRGAGADKRRQRTFDELLVRMATVVVYERVVDMDPIERAGLTPAKLIALSRIEPRDIEYLRRRLTRPDAAEDPKPLLVPEGI